MTAAVGNKTARTARLFYFDAVRALLMLLGLPYHIARIYAEGGDTFVASDQQSLALDWFSEFLHSFRMEAFFVIAGFFSYLILVRGETRHWLWSRVIRIGIPLLFCSLLLGPIATGATVMADVRLGNLPAADAAGEWLDRLAGSPGSWVYHLWFLHSLILLSLALAGLRAVLGRGRPLAFATDWADSCTRWLGTMPALVGGLVLAGFCLIFWLGVLVLEGPLGINLSPFGSFFRIGKTAQFLPFFLIGAMLARSSGFLAWMIKADRISLAMAILFSALFASIASGIIDIENLRTARLLLAIGACTAGVFWLKALLSLAARHLPGQNALVQYFSEASYSIYLVHLPIALWLGALLIGVMLPPVVEFAAILVVTLVLSVGCHNIIRRSSWLGLLMNGKSRGRADRAPTA